MLLDVEDQFIQLEGIIVELLNLQLPRADVRSVIQHMLELIKIYQRALDLSSCMDFTSELREILLSRRGTVRPQ